MESIDGVTVVIRSVKERTEELCKQLILNQGILEENLFIIRETPFSKAMKVSYQIGIDHGFPFTYIIDADVMLRDGAIKEMVGIIKQMPENTLGIAGSLLDKFFGKKRTAGNHLFNTKYLHHMIEGIQPYQEENIRPESTIIKGLRKKGLIFKKNILFIGLHDFEQHYHDISRKAFTHSQKHSEYISELVAFWQQSANYDLDYHAALFGLSKGIIRSKEIKINTENFADLYNEANTIYGLKSNEIEDFKIKSSEDIHKAMCNPDNYFKPDVKLAELLDKKFRLKFNEMNYRDLIKRFGTKIKNDLRDRTSK